MINPRLTKEQKSDIILLIYQKFDNPETKSIDEIEQTSLGGNVNQTLALGQKGVKNLVIRFDQNPISDRLSEQVICQLLGEAKIGPEILE